MSRPKIGEILIRKSLLTQDELDYALKQQELTGTRLGAILIGEGKLTAYRFHRELADQLGLQFIDVEKDPCEPSLLESQERRNYLRLQAVPWRITADAVIIATTDLTPEVRAWAEKKYARVGFAITSPYDIFWTVQKHFAEEDDGEARELLWRNQPSQSARQLLTSPAQRIMAAALLLALAIICASPMGLQSMLIAVNLFFAATLCSKALFHMVGIMENAKHHPANTGLLKEAELPIYTLLIPCYQEKAQTIAQLVESIRALDYPKSKLDVKLVVEADDNGTINNIKRLSCESYFEIIRVPYSQPRTKPKACNYALSFARGEFITIYDAEDRPDPQQLRKVLATFMAGDEKLGCVQAKLNYYNHSENPLTRMFAIEYASWFNFMLPGLEKLGLPIPLGGTSNHFRTATLRKLLGWDPYNVTEDADLGIRLVRQGYTTRIVHSTTLEEAPVHLGQWMKQRARWIKGYMQTYMVHMRNPLEIFRTLGLKGAMGFAFFVGAPPLVFLSLPIATALSIYAYNAQLNLPQWFWNVAWGNLIGGIALHWAIGLLAVWREGWRGAAPYTLLFPLYWLLHSVASFRALWQLMVKPHHWDKTEHGLSRFIHTPYHETLDKTPKRK